MCQCVKISMEKLDNGEVRRRAGLGLITESEGLVQCSQLGLGLCLDL